MNKKRLLFLILISAGIKSFCAGELRIAGGRAAGMGGCSIAMSDLWSVQNNPAGTAWLKKFSVGISFSDKFLLKELSQASFGVVIPVKAGTFGLSLFRFGSKTYNEIKVGLTFARKFGNHFSAGVMLDYQRIGLSEIYGSKSLFSFEAGVNYRADKHICIGLHLVNPVPVKVIKSPQESLPTLIRLGLVYEFSDTFLVCLEAEKDLQHPPVFRFGAEYHFVKPSFIRIGIATNPMVFSFGFGIMIGGISLDIASEYHQILGFSPGGSLMWSGKK